MKKKFQQVRQILMQMLSGTNNRLSTYSADVDELEVSLSTRCPRSSGGNTFMYLREKSEKKFALMEEKYVRRRVRGLRIKGRSLGTTICINVTTVSRTVSSIDDVDK